MITQQVLSDLESTLMDNALNPCADGGGSCLRHELDRVKFYDKVKDERLCCACGAAWHVARARYLFLRAEAIRKTV